MQKNFTLHFVSVGTMYVAQFKIVLNCSVQCIGVLHVVAVATMYITAYYDVYFSQSKRVDCRAEQSGDLADPGNMSRADQQAGHLH